MGAPSTITTGTANVQGATALTVASGTAFSTVGAFVMIDSTSTDGGAEVVTVSSAGSSTSIPIANTPLRLTHAAGATVQTATHGTAPPDDLAACYTRAVRWLAPGSRIGVHRLAVLRHRVGGIHGYLLPGLPEAAGRLGRRDHVFPERVQVVVQLP